MEITATNKIDFAKLVAELSSSTDFNIYKIVLLKNGWSEEYVAFTTRDDSVTENSSYGNYDVIILYSQPIDEHSALEDITDICYDRNL